MNRRSTIRIILALGALGGAGVLSLKSIRFFKEFDEKLFISKKELIDELTETIIPRTDTPGAKDAMVGSYVVKMIINCTELKTQNLFLEGLINVDREANKFYNKPFMNCKKSEREDVLNRIEERDSYSIKFFNKLQKKVFGESFFMVLKWLTIEGYCTSEIGATQGLAYDYIPGNYQGCLPSRPNQKSWATK